MTKNSVTIQETIDFLNSALEVDRTAISRLFETRQPCNEQLANHPTIQISQGDYPLTGLLVGPLGFLNGLFGVDEKGLGPITMVVKIDGTITEFRRTDPSAYPQ